MPLPSVVEKVLETKSKELLPKITEIVDQLRQARTKAPDSINTTSIQPTDSQSSSKSSNGLASESTKLKLTEFGSLPIDIPGLNLSSNSSKKELPAVATIASSDGKTVKGKSKVSDVVSSKETRGGGLVKSKPAQGTGSGSKPTNAKESGKQKDKDEKGTSNKGSDEVVSKAAKGSVKPKKAKDEAKETVVSGQKEEPQENTVTSISDSKEKGSDDRKELETKEQKTTSSKTETKSSKLGQAKGKEKDTNNDKETESNEKPATTRRSARLESLTESKDVTKKDEGIEGGEQGTEDHPTEVATPSLENERKRKGRKRSRGSKNSSQSVGQKRPRMISSSSEDSKAEVSSENEDHLSKNERRTDESSTANKGRGKSKDASNVPKTKSSRKRPQQHSHEEPAQVQRKKPKTKSNENESKTTVYECTQEEEHPVEQHVDSKPNKRKTKKPQRLPQRASKSPPVVITRYNRHVKPNRRYLDTSGNEAEAKSDDEGGIKEGEAAENTMVSGDSDFDGDNEGSEAGYSSCDEEEEERISPPNSEKTSKQKTDRTE